MAAKGSLLEVGNTQGVGEARHAKGHVLLYHPAYLIYMQSTSWEMLVEEAQAGIKIARRNINNLRYADNATLVAEAKSN